MDWSKHTVYVHGPGAFAYQSMFLKKGLKGTDDINEATIVCFTGGEDVSPSLYGEENLVMHGRKMSGNNPDRDDTDAVIHGYAVANEAFQVGICRGGQFLNVMNGGKMWQHVDGHAGVGHHMLHDTITGEVVTVTSTHHQMMRPSKDGEVLAIARESRSKWSEKDEWHITEADTLPAEWFDDIEVVWYPSTRCLCFQPHPEYAGAPGCTDYFFDLIEHHIN